ncbi:MAG: hypothetical protein K2V38_25500, partial [Gemmataceae bacterium]|nr:hypothetical protein [Gemmataceae bacterium]
IALVDGLADIEEAHDKKIEALVRQPNPPEDAFEKLDKEQRQATDKLLTEAAAKSLTAAQRKRLAQVDLHVRGVAAFADERVAKLLQLTDAQKKIAAQLAKEQRAAAEGFLDGPNAPVVRPVVDDEAQRKAELLKTRAGLLKKMTDALTADQKTNWANLLGDAPTAFDVNELWLKVEDEFDPPPGDK